jgi:hypothetical protein
MPNGKPGDDPLLDILGHGLDVYSPRVAALVRKIAALADEKTRRELGDRLQSQYSPYLRPDVAKLERELIELRDRLTREALDRRFEIPSE